MATATDAGAIRAGGAFVTIGVDDQLTRGLRQAHNKLMRFGRSMSRMSRQFTLMGAAMSVPITMAVRRWAEFDRSLSRTRGITRATTEQMRMLTMQAKELGATTVFSARQAADGMYILAKAGFDVTRIFQSMPAVLNLAAVGEMDVAESADVAAKIMAGMRIEADRLSGAVDMMVKTFTKAPTTLHEIGEAMKFIGPNAAAAGWAIEEVLAAIGILAQRGITAEMSGTALRGIMIGLTSPSKQAREHMDAIGVSAGDAVGRVKSLADMVEQFNEQVLHLPRSQMIGQLGRIFHRRQVGPFLNLMLAGEEAIRKFTKAVREAQGESKRLAEDFLDNLAGDFIRLKSVTEGLALALLGRLDPAMRAFVQYTTKIVRNLRIWADESAVLVAILGGSAGLVAIILGMTTALAVMAALMGFVVMGVTALWTGFFALLGVGVKLAGVLAVIAAVMATLQDTRFNLFRGFDSLSGITPVLDKLRELWSRDKSVLKDALAGGYIVEAFKLMWADLRVALQEEGGKFLMDWAAFVQAMVTVFDDALRFILQTLNGMTRAYHWIRGSAAMLRGGLTTFAMGMGTGDSLAMSFARTRTEDQNRQRLRYLEEQFSRNRGNMSQADIREMGDLQRMLSYPQLVGSGRMVSGGIVPGSQESLQQAGINMALQEFREEANAIVGDSNAARRRAEIFDRPLMQAVVNGIQQFAQYAMDSDARKEADELRNRIALLTTGPSAALANATSRMPGAPDRGPEADMLASAMAGAAVGMFSTARITGQSDAMILAQERQLLEQIQMKELLKGIAEGLQQWRVDWDYYGRATSVFSY